MGSSVIELQKLASDSNSSLIDLLRKALVVATKLKLPDFKKWIESELKGYGNTKVMDIPKYRHTTCEIRCRNPYHGWIPYIIQDPNFACIAQEVPIANGVAELEEFAADPKSTMVIPFNSEVLKIIMDSMGQLQMEPRRFVPG